MHATGRYKILNLIFGVFPFIGAVLIYRMRDDSGPIHCETRTGVIDNGKRVNSKITTYKVVIQKGEINNIFIRMKL